MKKYDLLYCIGDSWTFAMHQSDDIHLEINVDNRFTNLVANHFGLECINHGMPGCGNEYIARNIYKDIFELKAKGVNPLVIVTYTDHWRREIYSSKHGRPITISDDTVPFFKDYMVENYDNQYAIDCSVYYMVSIKTLLKYHNIDFVDGWSMVGLHPTSPFYLDKSTELEIPFTEIVGPEGRFWIESSKTHGHANVLGNRKIADFVIEKINTLYGTS